MVMRCRLYVWGGPCQFRSWVYFYFAHFRRLHACRCASPHVGTTTFLQRARLQVCVQGNGCRELPRTRADTLPEQPWPAGAPACDSRSPRLGEVSLGGGWFSLPYGPVSGPDEALPVPGPRGLHRCGTYKGAPESAAGVAGGRRVFFVGDFLQFCNFFL